MALFGVWMKLQLKREASRPTQLAGTLWALMPYSTLLLASGVAATSTPYGEKMLSCDVRSAAALGSCVETRTHVAEWRSETERRLRSSA
jgi:hypothetical protein